MERFAQWKRKAREFKLFLRVIAVRAARNDGENDVGIWMRGAPLLGHVRAHVGEHGGAFVR
jgi:hypothetical protein